MMQEKRVLPKKRAYHDPIINPPKPKVKNKQKIMASAVTKKDLANPKNILARTKQPNTFSAAAEASVGAV